jgi:hypothetical protein
VDKITFDFEKKQIVIENDSQNGVMTAPDLATRKTAILKAAGLEAVDLRTVADALEQYLAGQISEEELDTKLNAWAEER